YKKKFWTWWSGLQPEFRPLEEGILVMNGDGCPVQAEGDWEAMRLPGANGWLSVIARLCFWWERAAADRACASWISAVKDVKWV
ncbi:hypothetical protein ARMGADRAFT_858345, partial [Armillaria gallica]